MPRQFLFLLCSAVALAQTPARDPFDAAVQAYRDAHASGNFDQAAARREEARGLLAQTPLDSPLLLNRVQAVAEIYRSSGRQAQARAVLQEALSRADSGGESHPARLQLLDLLAGSWQQDGNLLKALSFREKAVEAVKSGPPGAPPRANRSPVYATGMGGSYIVGTKFGTLLQFSGSPGDNSYMYQQLAALYRQLGRPESADKVMAKIRNLVQNDPRALAAFYESSGDLDEAVGLYKKQAAEAAANPKAQIWEIVNPLQSIAHLYQRQERWADAAAILEQTAAQLEASGRPEARNQAVVMRLNLATALQQAGQSQASEKLYQTLLAENANDRNGAQFEVLQTYANHLSNTNRAGEGEQLLKSYLDNHADLEPQQEAGLFPSLSHMAQRAGHRELAQQYEHAAQEKQRDSQPRRSAEAQLIGPDLQKAQTAANQGNLDEAVNLALQSVASASLARDREQVAWQVPSIATTLASKKAPDKGDMLYGQLLPMLQTWSVDNTGPLVQALEQYARFVMGQKDRWGEASAAIERYRACLVAAQGAETGGLEQVMHLRIDFARATGQAEAVQSAEELLAFEESLSGSTSAPYMRAAQSAAEAYEFAGNSERAVALHRQIVAIADRTLLASDAQRAFVRMNAALAFSRVRRFDEAERLANEAVSIEVATRFSLSR